MYKTKRHNHKESQARKHDVIPEGFDVLGKPNHSYHGYCTVTGTHMIDAVCACGAVRYIGNGKCPHRWVGGDYDE